ncbi:poliovirus receptor homolog isoform X2 [Erinaceus europaeus]|uniref:Poliovirus receptor homolog isoform X2 n=1 Tax=Erinaceus europaeus TaxID=9365 RepID=A0A1S3WNI9_ERIEU|nr:poliovirus receptor homolog isoform X2 [Erinaceus europaeus]
MAAPQPWPPRLSLLSLLLTWAPSGAGARKVEVQAPPQVRGLLGDAVHLPCLLQPLEPGVQVTQLTWMRRDPGGAARNVAVFHPQRGPSFPEPGRWAFAAARTSTELRDGSLDLSALRATDEANYTCEFATFPQGSGSARTWLRVLAKPENKAEIQPVPLGPQSLGPVPVARCVSSGGRPPPQISWLSAPDWGVNESQVPGPLPGTVTVISLLMAKPSSKVDGRNVTCNVTHESLEEPRQLSLTLEVPYFPEVSISGYDDNWYLGQREAVLSCDVRSNPEPTSYNWSTTEGSLPAFAEAQDSQLLIHLEDKPINMTFICQATNALGSNTAKQSILVRAPPKEWSQSGFPLWAIAPITVMTVSLLIVGGLCYKHPGKYCQCFRRSSANVNNTIYSAVNTT